MGTAYIPCILVGLHTGLRAVQATAQPCASGKSLFVRLGVQASRTQLREDAVADVVLFLDRSQSHCPRPCGLWALLRYHIFTEYLPTVRSLIVISPAGDALGDLSCLPSPHSRCGPRKSTMKLASRACFCTHRHDERLLSLSRGHHRQGGSTGQQQLGNSGACRQRCGRGHNTL